MIRVIFLTLIFFGFLAKSYAACELSSVNDVFEKIKRNHPEIQTARAKQAVLERSIAVASLRPNPELDLDGSVTDTIDGNVYRVSASLKHTFEVGGKRSARMKIAESAMKYGIAEAEHGKQNVLINSVLRLHRLRQVHELIPIYEESLQAFNKILRSIRSRKSLSPEQQVEGETLELAINDYKLKVSELISEKLNLNRHLSFFIGEKCTIPLSALPQFPNLSQNFTENINSDNYSKLLAAKSKLKLAEANLNFEKANSYPNIQLGPTYEHEKAPFTHSNSFGISLTMDLPIFNVNSAGRAKAQKELIVSRKILENIKTESELDIEAWVTKYNQYRSSLNTIADKKRLERKHKKIEALFRRGIISTSLVIESHRQLTEFFTTRFDFELGAVEALWNIYKLNGQINKVKL